MLRREITTSGLFWALFVVLGVAGLIVAVIGVILGPSRALTASITLGAVSLIVLASFAYRRKREKDGALDSGAAGTAPGAARLTNMQFLAVELLWAIILAAAIIAMLIANGAKRAAFGVPVVMALAALIVLETRRRHFHE
jgi:hypothetical protein